MEHTNHSCGCGCGHEHHDCGCGHEHHDCGCGHAHHDCGCGCGHEHQHPGENEGRMLLLGGGLFVAGLVLYGFSWVAALAVCAAAALLLGWEIFRAAGKSLVVGHMLDENFLMSIAALGAFCIGEFPEAVGILLFYRIGEWFEHRASDNSRKRILEAVDLRPETVLLEDGTEVPAGAVKVGAEILVRPGDRIPLDGTVIAGSSRLDTAPITGESVPVGVGVGDSVTSGCVNLNGQLTVRVEKLLEDSMVTRILRAVENAAAGKPKMDRFISRFARYYTPAVVGAAALTALVPSLITGQWRYWIYTALSFLVMSCPCALVLSVPLTFFSGIGAGSKKGILFKGGASMEALAGVRVAALDKTGTVTAGDFRVRDCDPELLALCAACECNSTHPIAVSITAAARERGIVPSKPEQMEEIPGHGICARLEGKTLLCGNENLLQRYGVAFPQQDHSGTVVLVAVDGKYRGAVTVADTIKDGAAQAIRELKTLGVGTAMLTGDREETARAVAREIGIGQVFARLLPEEKLTHLQQLRQKYGPVLFVGDGINDAPVMAGADVGAAMGSGTDAAIEAADVVFMTSNVSAIPAAVRLAKRTRRVAWQNVIFALSVKALVMVLGLLGFASMWMAVFADSGVAMLCVLNAIGVLYRKES